MDRFELASRNKLRFVSTKGNLSAEDLWDLSLESLDSIAKRTNAQLRAASEESFINKKTTASSDLELAMDILKYVIGVKLQEMEDRKTRADRLAERQRIQEVLADKKNSELAGKSVEELQAMLAATQS